MQPVNFIPTVLLVSTDTGAFFQCNVFRCSEGDGGSSGGEKDVAVGRVGEGLVLDAQKELVLTNSSGFVTLTPKHVFVN